VEAGPTPEELAAEQAAEEEEQARQAALARERAEAARRRREAIARAQRRRAERAAEFRDVSGFSEAKTFITEDIDAAIRALDGVAVEAALAVPAETASSPEASSGRGSALLVLLLGASALSALLVLAASLAARSPRAEEIPADGGVRVLSFVPGRIRFVEGHRLELAGVSVGCLLFALLIFVGAL
jgi:hypothetical protein